MKKRSLKPQPVVWHKFYYSFHWQKSACRKKSISCKATLLSRRTKKTSYDSNLTEKSEIAIKKTGAGQNFSGFGELRNRRTRRHRAKILRANIAELTFVSMARSLQYLLFLQILFWFLAKNSHNGVRKFISAGVHVSSCVKTVNVTEFWPNW